ncbi:hypothetical protein FHP29_07245 [Nocardioides albidus]|uniref:VCBS repeat-containing protein n=1 Tax=Nocardioides albidus TaxID=1517589 RepID=A0A5C4W3L9_9ACTN|nr:hypothetical protein [Nocardioides albidus]TNM42790.1 hypothetical protein FHP29_07245 [Nocardioides albidus]
MRTIRKQLLGLTTAALAVGTLAVAGGPAQAVGGVDGGNISNFGDVPTSVDVAAFGSGDAIAAWTKPVVGGTKVYAAVATNGVWSAPKQVTAAPVTEAHDVHAVANGNGDLAVVWNQTTGGEQKVRGARYLGNGDWDGSTLLSPAVDIETVESIDAGIDAAGRVHVAYQSEDGGVTNVRATAWAKGAAPVLDDFGAHKYAPSLDVNPAGQVLMSYFASANGGDVMVTRRTASAGWLGPQPLVWNGAVSQDSVAELADDGRGAVVFGGVQNDGPRAVVARVDALGAVGNTELVSPFGAGTIHRDLSVSPNGTMQVTWAAFENDTTYVIRGAVAKPGQGFGATMLIDPGTVTNQMHRSLVSDGADQVVVHNDADQLTLRHHTNPVLPWSQYVAGATNGAFAADMDRDGNAVAVGIQENGFSSYVEADFLDIAGPAATVTGPGAQVGSPAFPVSWSVTDSLSGVKSVDVMVRSAAWNAGFGPQQVIANNVTTSAQPFAGTFGSTHCFQAQGADKANNLGLRSAERCTTVPLDDTSLAGKKWKRIAKVGAFNSTATVTKQKGRKLVLPGVQARHLDLIVGKAKLGGKVKVYWNGKVVRTISLKGKGSQVTVPVADFGGVQTGTLKIKVTSKDGRKVTIDGVVAAK